MKTLQKVHTSKVSSLSHIYQIIKTSQNLHPDEIAVASYSGLSFIKVHRKDGSTESNDEIDLYVATEKYLDGEFVNKVCEYAPDKLIAAIWDSDRYCVIDRKSKAHTHSIAHPRGDFKCWGLKLIPNIVDSQFEGSDTHMVAGLSYLLMSRDNHGLTLIDIKNRKCFQISILNSKIGKNLYGHGDILDIEIADAKDETTVDPATLRAPDLENYDHMSSNPLSKSRTEFGRSSR
jgi:hypothetical protein